MYYDMNDAKTDVINNGLLSTPALDPFKTEAAIKLILEAFTTYESDVQNVKMTNNDISLRLETLENQNRVLMSIIKQIISKDYPEIVLDNIEIY